MTQLAGIFGHPLTHSISPAFQQAAFDHCGLQVRYELWPTTPEGLADGVARLRGDAYLGANVTVPHKESVMALVDKVDPLAEAVGAVNTIGKDAGRLVGYNTDVGGFITALKRDGSFDPRGNRVLLLGAGGAARAAAFGLLDEGIASLAVANRTVARATALADELSDGRAEVTSLPATERALRDACVDADLIVNTTSVGMRGGSGEGASPLPPGAVPSGALVYDIVYNPTDTPLLVEARNRGAQALGGLPMLVYQGAASFERWTDLEAPLAVMFDAARKALVDAGRAAG